MQIQDDTSGDPTLRRKRLRYRAWHRGTREMDLLLGPFADAYLPAMEAAEMDRLERLMSEEDSDLLQWVIGQRKPPISVDSGLLDQLIAYRKTRGIQP